MFLAWRITWVVALWAAAHSTSRAENLPVVLDVEFQPLSAQVKRVIEALEMLGQPLARDEKARLEQALDSTGPESAIRAIQNVLDQHCLIGIEINPESRVKASQGPAAASPGPEWMVGLPGQGPQRGRRHGRARRREPQRRSPLPAGRPAARTRRSRSARPRSSSAGLDVIMYQRSSAQAMLSRG